jgi:outer membrane lipoprotein SlyB
MIKESLRFKGVNMFKKVLLASVCAMALAGCQGIPNASHTHHNVKHKHSDVEFVNARVEMIQQAPEVCTMKFEFTEDGRIAVGLLAGGLIGSGFGSGAGAALLVVGGASAGAVVGHETHIEQDKTRYKCRENGYEAKVTYFRPSTDKPVTQWIALDKKVTSSTIRLPVSVLQEHTH